MVNLMKKLLVFVCVAALAVSLCASALAAENNPSVVALKGPTAMGLVKLMKDDEAENKYAFTIAAAIDEVTPMLVKGEADIACLPANLASVLYNNTEGQIRVLAVNTLGVLYIVENGDSVQSVADLKGRTLYASGKGATPEYALDFILAQNGIDPEADVTIEWKSEHAECLAALLAEDGGVALLPQPFVTTALMKAEGLRVALDLNQEWDALGVDSTLITGVVVARAAFIDENPDTVASFMDEYAASVAFVNANTAEAAALVGEYDIVPEAVAAKALPACNITFIEGEALKAKLSGYLEVLMNANPKAVGGKLPEDDFYFAR